MAALVLDMFCKFYLVKNHKIAINSTTTNASEKIKTDLESFEFHNIFNVCLTKFETSQIFLFKISHRSLSAAKPFSGRKSLIQTMFLHLLTMKMLL